MYIPHFRVKLVHLLSFSGLDQRFPNVVWTGSKRQAPPNFGGNLKNLSGRALEPVVQVLGFDADRATQGSVHGIQQHELQLVAGFGRRVLQILGIAARDHDGGDAGALRGEDLLLQKIGKSIAPVKRFGW